MEAGFCLFDTPLGRCGLIWHGDEVLGLQLPEETEPDTIARIRRDYPGCREAEPPVFARAAIAAVDRMLSGGTDSLASIPLALERHPPFHRRVYRIAQSIPPGHTLTYGEVATRLDSPGAARAVGQALGRNPFAIIVPCHRVVGAGRNIGGFSAHGGTTTKLRLLALERGYDFDPARACAHLRRADPVLKRLIGRAGEFTLRIERSPDTFGILAKSLVSQQLSGKAAAVIFGRLTAQCGTGDGWPSAPEVVAASDETLRGVGLSGAKVVAIRQLAEKACSGELPTLAALRELDDEAVIARLSALRGIGRWTAEMFLMFSLGRPDVMPVDDLGVRKGFQRLYQLEDLPERKVLAHRAERWRPYRSIATWYLWRATELETLD